jgi:hypothetical protein
MKVTTMAEGKTVYQLIEMMDHTKKIKVRTCNTETEAKALVNYYKVRRA